MFTFHFLLILLRQLYKFATNMGEWSLFCRIERELGVRSSLQAKRPYGSSEELGVRRYGAYGLEGKKNPQHLLSVLRTLCIVV